MVRSHNDADFHEYEEPCDECLLEHFRKERLKTWLYGPIYVAIPFVLFLWFCSWDKVVMPWAIGFWIVFTLILAGGYAGEMTRRIDIIQNGGSRYGWFSHGPTGRKFLR